MYENSLTCFIHYLRKFSNSMPIDYEKVLLSTSTGLFSVVAFSFRKPPMSWWSLCRRFKASRRFSLPFMENSASCFHNQANLCGFPNI